MDHFSSNSRGDKTAKLAGCGPDEMVAADKANFQVPYSFVNRVGTQETQLRQRIAYKDQSGKDYKFRMDNQSKDSIRYVLKVFHEFLPGKIFHK